MGTEDMTLAEKKQMALDIILDSVSDEIREWLLQSGVTDPRTAWAILEARYGGGPRPKATPMHTVELEWRLNNLRMREEGEKVSTVVGKFLALRDELAAAGRTFSEELLVLLLLQTLPKSWEIFHMTWIHRTEELTVNTLTAKMLQEETFRQLRGAR